MTAINHLKLANCAIDQCYTAKQPLCVCPALFALYNAKSLKYCI